MSEQNCLCDDCYSIASAFVALSAEPEKYNCCWGHRVRAQRDEAMRELAETKQQVLELRTSLRNSLERNKIITKALANASAILTATVPATESATSAGSRK